ncbi:choice-of-anchor L domain-containing protein [Kineococcus xinjiangensis]|nr:choice-of-anchor L domain-containing protein [Kineococcus xinjiangensis]
MTGTTFTVSPATAAPSALNATTDAAATTARLAGADRYATAAAIAVAAFPKGAGVVYLARGDVPADALAAGSLSDGPVLLVPSCGPAPITTLAAVKALRPTQVVALGGQGAVCDNLLTSVAASVGASTHRLAGQDRYQTSVLIAQRAFPSGSRSVYIASGADTAPDAVAGGALTDGPILTVPSAGPVPATVAAEIARLRPEKVIALGGPATISEALLTAAAAGKPTARLAGADRYASAAAIAAAAIAQRATTPAKAYIARGDVFADALAAGSLTDGPVLLVPSCAGLPDSVQQSLRAMNAGSVIALGGEGAICTDTLTAAARAATAPQVTPPSATPPATTPPVAPPPVSTPTTGTVRVKVNAPDGVAANVELRGGTYRVAAKSPEGTSSDVALTMPAGTYQIQLPSVTVNGTRYVGTTSQANVTVAANQSSNVEATYVADGGARDLHATALTADSVTLTWTAPKGTAFSLRRTSGDDAATDRSQGVEVAVDGTTATDTGLSAGTQYTYSLFTLNQGVWTGPLSVVAGTAPTAGSTDAAYVATPTTVLTEGGDITSAKTTGTGVQVVLSSTMATPPLGSAIILPISQALPGGFLGTVTAISADGRTLDLTATGLGDAFDYYDLNVAEFTVAPAPASPASLLKPTDLLAGLDLADTEVAAADLAVSPAAKGQPKGQCEFGGGSSSVEFAPSVGMGGHFKTKIDKHNNIGPDLPVGASVDMSVYADMKGAAKVEVSGAYACGVNLPQVFKPLTVSPVPISMRLAPTAEVSAGGALSVSNIGVSAKAGFAAKGTMSVKEGVSFSGSPIMEVAALEPEVKANGSLALKAGGELIIGPGVGTSDAGVIAGVSGKLNPIDASFEPYFAATDSRYNACIDAKAEFSRSLSLVATAWIPVWEHTEEISFEALKGSTPYFGSPWELPKGCKSKGAEETPDPGTQDSLLGDGVTKVDDKSVGGGDQWGHLDGFVPGKKAWVLSTGHISNALGSPDKFASTELNRPGDSELSALAGFPTHDAASYEVTLIPEGDNLHVRYVFASEEYPEFVGSAFNDVMSVRVDGKLCSNVPGTDEPVAVNTINAIYNSKFYVDNANGAAGYATSMDGLTTPLTCSVPVTPGKAVTVKIALADTSDESYDSAVALIDGGIWTD